MIDCTCFMIMAGSVYLTQNLACTLCVLFCLTWRQPTESSSPSEDNLSKNAESVGAIVTSTQML